MFDSLVVEPRARSALAESILILTRRQLQLAVEEILCRYQSLLIRFGIHHLGAQFERLPLRLGESAGHEDGIVNRTTDRDCDGLTSGVGHCGHKKS